jgi:ubiquinone/menaquinone biosynthesis C-methylase UbiE
MAVVERYAIRGGRAGYDRLALLAEARRDDTRELLELAGVRTGMACLDLGCGGGEVSFDIARLVGPAGRVVGLDMDEVKLDLGRASASASGLANVELRCRNVEDWSEPDSYDLVYSRFLLQHLSRPVELLRQMWSAVRPGGVLVVEDADFDGLFSEPRNDGLEFFARIYPRLLERRGGDAAIGRKLYRHMLDAGIPRPALRLVQRADAVGEVKAMVLSTLEATAEPIVEDRLASGEEVRRAIAGLAAFTSEADTVVSGPRVFQLWRQRPRGA